jgi:hypothetical protein
MKLDHFAHVGADHHQTENLSGAGPVLARPSKRLRCGVRKLKII